MKESQLISIRDVPGGCVLGDSLKIATSAAPEKGRANSAVAAIIAKSLGLDKRSVELIAGAANPHKEFRIANMSASSVHEILKQMP